MLKRLTTDDLIRIQVGLLLTLTVLCIFFSGYFVGGIVTYRRVEKYQDRALTAIKIAEKAQEDAIHFKEQLRTRRTCSFPEANPTTTPVQRSSVPPVKH